MHTPFNPFPKREYLRTINRTINESLLLFGYSKRPLLFETRLEPNVLMMFNTYPARGAMFYDYEKFRKFFAGNDAFTQTIYTAFYAAHEMRHYYQHRQMRARRPVESPEVIAEWRDNDANTRYPGADCSVLDFYLQPLELDAEVFAYWYVAKRYGAGIDLDYVDKSYFDFVKNKYIEMFGDDDEDLYIFDISERINTATVPCYDVDRRTKHKRLLQ